MKIKPLLVPVICLVLSSTALAFTSSGDSGLDSALSELNAAAGWTSVPSRPILACVTIYPL